MTDEGVDLDRRFGGIIRLYGEKKFRLIQDCHICVVGIGGVGSWVAESLARHGIGKITLIDMDHIVDPTCLVDCIDDFLEESNIESHISSKFDFIIDAIDQSSVKISLAEYCQSKNLSLVMVGGAGGRVDPARIKIADISKTFGDPLISNIRKHFNNKNKLSERKYEIPTIFSDEPSIKSDACKTDQLGGGLSCDGYGSSLNITATMAFYVVAHIFSKI